MYLKSLTCKGFKSFADRAVLSMEPGITAIIGPNGSGKSNVLDAVRWVLGERNARNLRGQAMEDVIFAGSSTRKPVGMAEVELVLDNSDATLPVDYDEVSITRRFYRNGEGEYLINGVLCRRMDVIDILHDSGLGQDTHSIISQGHLDSVLRSRPEERRTLIEEAAGVLKHKQRMARSERRIERMDLHLARIRDINREVERQLKPLARKAKRALSYQSLTSELAQVTLDLAVDDLRVLQKKWDETHASEKELAARLESQSQSVHEAEKSLQDLQAQLRERTDGVDGLAEQLRRATRAADRVDAALSMIREKKRSAALVSAQRREQQESDRARLAALEAEEAKSKAALKDAQAQRAAADENLSRVSHERDEASRALKELRREVSSLEKDEARLVKDDARLRKTREKAAEAAAAAQADARLLDAQDADMTRRAAESQTRAEELAQSLKEAKASLQAAQEARAAAEERVKAARGALDAAREAQEAAREQVSRIAARRAGLEESQRLAQAANPAFAWADKARERLAVKTTLMDAIHMPADIAPVVEMLLGEGAEAFMVADAQTAHDDAAAALQADATGTALFVAMEHAAPSQPLTLAHGVPGYLLIDEISCDDNTREALIRLLGDAVLCADATEAKACAQALAKTPHAWRVVTKDGYLASSCGTAGVTRRASDSLGTLERHAQIEDAIKQERLCREQLEAADAAVQQAREQADAAHQELLTQQAASAKARGTCDSLTQQMSQAEKNQEKLKREAEELARRRENNQQLLERMRPDSQRVEDEIAAITAELAQVRASLAEKREGLAPSGRKNAQLNERCTELRLEAGRLAEREAYARRMLEGHEGDLARLKAQMAQRETRVRQGVPARDVDAVANSLRLVRESLSDSVLNIERAVEECREGASTLHARVEEANRRLAFLRTESQQSGDALSELRVEKGRLEVRVQTAIASIRDDCGTPLEQALARPELASREESEEHAASLRRRLTNLGPVNPDAAREYDELKQRYDYLKGQVDDIEAARRALAKVENALEKRLQESFTETFRAVDANFQRIFSELFPGGHATLELVEREGEEAGVEVNAQPAGKRITKMSLMSGGEKSLTALALLFAVYATRPTPFYILDEVEAALDDTNLRRLCAYLDVLRDKTQLIMITHQRRTMEMSDVLYGISMQADGVTKVISQKLDRKVEKTTDGGGVA